MLRTTRQPDNVFSLAAISDLENLVKDVAKDFGDIAEARNLSDKANLHIERVLKLRHAKSYLQSGGKLPLATIGGAVPW